MYVGDRHSLQIQAAEMQSFFRDINERIRNSTDAVGGRVVVDGGVCECANEDCLQHLHLAPEEYERVRAVGTRFIVAPDESHVFPDVEQVIDKHDRYWVVEKIEDAGRLAERLAA